MAPNARQILDWARDMAGTFWPPSCAVCGSNPCEDRGGRLCRGCARSLSYLSPPYCPVCGRPFPKGTSPVRDACGFCLQYRPHFDAARARCLYKGTMSHAIKEFKFNSRRHYRALLEEIILEAAAELPDIGEAALVVPVPLHPSRLRERGFNQAVDLARPVARSAGAELAIGCLVRRRATKPQYGLTIKQRRRNVKGAFQATDPFRVRGKTVVLVDDIITTGATVEECSRVLKKAGAEKVLVAALARAE